MATNATVAQDGQAQLPPAQPKKRKRYGKLPKPDFAPAPWANARLAKTHTPDEIDVLAKAEHVLAVVEHDAWQNLMKPVCEALDKKRASRGRKILYSSEELEIVMAFAWACEIGDYKAARNLLAGDRADARIFLGFDKPRNDEFAVDRMKLRDGVPSEATMSRHRKRFPVEKRVEIWLEIEAALRDSHLAMPEMQDELLVIANDGTKLETVHVGPIKSVKTGEILNEKQVTAPTAGFVGGPDVPPDKAGFGWNLITTSTMSCVPLVWEVVKLHESEKTEGTKLLDGKFRQVVSPYIRDKYAVFVADGGFHSPAYRDAARRASVVDLVHHHSHAKDSEATAAKTGKKLYAIDYDGNTDWRANGHREISCKCGAGKTERDFDKKKDGETVSRVVGRCKSCGTISITAGDWMLNTNLGIFVRCNTDTPVEKRDYQLGNSLTFNDPIALEYGRGRFSRNEGFYAMLSNAYGLNRKRSIKSQDQAVLETAMSFALIHAASMKHRLRQRDLDGGAANLASAA